MELSEGTAMIPFPDQYHCPSRLETLTRMDQLLVYRERITEDRLAEVCCGIKPVNRYFVKDGMGNMVFSIIEDSECCDRQCYGVGHSFTMHVTDHSNQEVIRMVHPSVCTACSSHELEVQSPPGTTVGYVRQNWHVCLPKFTLDNERGEPAVKIAGPCIGCTCCTDENFELVSLNDAAIDGSFGKITKHFSCCGSDADFEIRFPRNMDVKMKATTLGACILIDSMYYTSQKASLLCVCLSVALGYWQCLNWAQRHQRLI
ncbi:phospholipid scramblase 2-like [Puntigrus tetrazona]|uniref:phospholipid scramblase 2-like n=1 Tax=Puntigrus tetrazona TaxID=1606681 RepID=UPI001C89284E|nr:phospholipid scramblase 2-like [Puntigrus tetrazona]